MFEEYTYETILNRMLSRVSPEVDKREGSVIYDALAPAALELQLLYIELDNMLKQCFADTADRTWLVMRAKERGIEPYSATNAVLRGVFEPETAEVEGKRFNADSLNYTVGETLEDGGRAVYCESAGAEGSRYLGVMTPLEYIPNLVKATLTEVLTEGKDEEDTEDFRLRYFESLNTQAFGGNCADYIQKLQALNDNEDVTALGGIGQVRIYSADQWNGGGTVKAVVTARDNSPCIPQLISLIQEYIDPVANKGKGSGIAPVGHIVTIASVNTQSVDISLSVTAEEGYTAQILTPFIEAEIEKAFDALAEQWEKTENGLELIVSKLAASLQDIVGIKGISNINVGGAVFGGVLTLNNDCFPVLGDLNVEVS